MGKYKYTLISVPYWVHTHNEQYTHIQLISKAEWVYTHLLSHWGVNWGTEELAESHKWKVELEQPGREPRFYPHSTGHPAVEGGGMLSRAGGARGARAQSGEPWGGGPGQRSRCKATSPGTSAVCVRAYRCSSESCPAPSRKWPLKQNCLWDDFPSA